MKRTIRLIVFAASNIFSGIELPSLTIPKDLLKISSSSAEFAKYFSSIPCVQLRLLRKRLFLNLKN